MLYSSLVAAGQIRAPHNLLLGAGILFMGYEGFGLITNAAGEMTSPRRELPRAIYLIVGIVMVIYVLVAVVMIGNLSISALRAAEDSALVEAARPFLGQFGFTLIAIATLLSTSSAVNATQMLRARTHLSLSDLS